MKKNLRKKVDIREQEVQQSKKLSSTKKNKNSQEIATQQKNNYTKKQKKNANKLGLFFTKTRITYFILFLLDIILVIYSARKNIVNYVTVLDEDVFVSKTRYLFLGRNYINLIITSFFYLYICLMNRFFLQRKNTKKFMSLLLVILLILNLILFFLFTKRVY